MKYLKLFEAFSKKNKVYKTNSIFIDWLIFNWLVQNEIKVFQDPNSYSHYYRFVEPVTNAILFTLSDDIVGDAKAKVFDYKYIFGTEAYRHICHKPANIGHIIIADALRQDIRQDIINLLVKPLKRYIKYKGYIIKSFKMFESSTAAATAAIAMKQSLDRLSSHGRKKDANREDDLSKIKDELDQKYDYDTGEEGMEDMMDEEGMEDVMDEEGIIKTFDELNEAFNKEVVFYKIVDTRHLDSILEEGLFPGPDGGTYTIAEENFNDWLKPNKLFGSLLQALLFFPATRKQKCALLKIKTKPQLVRVRDVSLMLQDMKKWNKSSVYIHDINDTNFEISEYIIMGIVPASKIEVLNKFTAIDDIKKFKINPQSLKDYVFGLSNDLKKVGKISMPRLLLKYFWLKLKLKYF